jgi:Ca-activated chloride channel family protein
MTQQVVLMTEEEVSRFQAADEEAGFGALDTARGRLPLKAMDVQAQIEGLLVQVDVSQTFVNNLGEPLEATYIFPLPDRAAVTRFRMEVAGRVIEGVLKERAQARRDYDRAIQEGYRAAITEEERPGVFTMRVGNLMPGETATVKLTLSGPLCCDGGEATFRFPLVVAPRYIPGSPLDGAQVGSGVEPDTDAVPDASRISPPVLLPGYPNPVRLSLAVDLPPADLALTDFRSSLHVVTETTEGYVRRIALNPGERLDRDFILRFRVDDAALQPSLALVPDKEGKQEGTFALTLVPPQAQTDELRPRDVIFVLDRSGSMGGWKMVAARRALGRLIDTLTERDHFSVYAFDDRIETPPDAKGFALLPATNRQRFRAVEFLAKIDARGGTELAQPLEHAVKELAKTASETTGPKDRERILVLITDGQVGNEDQILRALGKRLANLRIFTLGIDQAVNAGFLKRLAALGGGFCELVESEDRLDEVMDKLHGRIATPVLTGLRLEAAGFRLDPETIVPAHLPDLFAGAAVTIMGRYRGAAKGSLVLQATDAVGQSWAQTVAAHTCRSHAVCWAWARARVRELEDRYVVGGDDVDKLEKVIVETSLQFGVLCRFTAFVAVDQSDVANKSGKQHHILQPVEAPAGWEMLGKGASTLAAASFMGATACDALRAMPDAGSIDEIMRCESMPSDVAVDFDMAASDILLPAPIISRQQQSPGTPPKARSRPLLRKRKLSSAIFGSTDSEQHAARQPAALDFTAYRRRAADLLNELKNGRSDRVRELGILAVKLAALTEDLKSIGAASEEIEPLVQLVAALQKLVRSKRPKDTAVNALWTQAEAVLSGFAQMPATTGASRKDDFWK